MKFGTWNMAHHTRSERHDEAWTYLRGLELDVACLQEVRLPPGADPTAFMHTRPRGVTWCAAVVGQGVSPWPLPLDSLVPRLAHRVAVASVTTSIGRLLVASVHATTGEPSAELMDGVDRARVTRPSGAVWPSDIFYAALVELTAEAEHFIVAGDWMETVLADARKGGTAGAEFFDRAEADGWVDATSDFFRIPRLDIRTWFGQHHGRNDVPYQLDRVFVDQGLAKRIVNCDVLAHPAQCLELSDHAPVVVDFDFEARRPA